MPLSLQGARTDCKMPQRRGAREKGTETSHRVLAADTGGEGTLELVDQEAGWLVGPHDTVFSNGISTEGHLQGQWALRSTGLKVSSLDHWELS